MPSVPGWVLCRPAPPMISALPPSILITVPVRLKCLKTSFPVAPCFPPPLLHSCAGWLALRLLPLGVLAQSSPLRLPSGKPSLSLCAQLL